LIGIHRTIQTTDTLCGRATEPKDLQNDTTMAEIQSVQNNQCDGVKSYHNDNDDY
jgi:hypothetical protein